MRPLRRSLPLVPLLAALAAGCGIANPYEASRTQRDVPAATVPSTVTTPADTGPFPGAGATPQATLRRAAALAGNWTSEDAPAVFRRLAAMSAGEAKAQFAQIAAGARSDTLQAGTGARSSATVVALVVRGTGDVRHAVVVTRERVSAPQMEHLPPEYRVTLATVERRGAVWVATSWRPQP